MISPSAPLYARATERVIGVDFCAVLLRSAVMVRSAVGDLSHEPLGGVADVRYGGGVAITPISVGNAMIDNPEQVERLVAELRESLPLLATITPAVAAIIREQSPVAELSRPYPITRVDYAGDEGGIVCKVELGPESDDRAIFASITHLRFSHAGPIARKIAAYQKHRVKRLKRLGKEK